MSCMYITVARPGQAQMSTALPVVRLAALRCMHILYRLPPIKFYWHLVPMQQAGAFLAHSICAYGYPKLSWEISVHALWQQL